MSKQVPPPIRNSADTLSTFASHLIHCVPSSLENTYTIYCLQIQFTGIFHGSFSPAKGYCWFDGESNWEKSNLNFFCRVAWWKKKYLHALLELQGAKIDSFYKSSCLTAVLCDPHGSGKKIDEWQHWTIWQTLTARQQYYTVKFQLKVMHGKGSDVSETKRKFFDKTRKGHHVVMLHLKQVTAESERNLQIATIMCIKLVVDYMH